MQAIAVRCFKEVLSLLYGSPDRPRLGFSVDEDTYSKRFAEPWALYQIARSETVRNLLQTHRVHKWYMYRG